MDILSSPGGPINKYLLKGPEIGRAGKETRADKDLQGRERHRARISRGATYKRKRRARVTRLVRRTLTKRSLGEAS